MADKDYTLKATLGDGWSFQGGGENDRPLFELLLRSKREADGHKYLEEARQKRAQAMALNFEADDLERHAAFLGAKIERSHTEKVTATEVSGKAVRSSHAS